MKKVMWIEEMRTEENKRLRSEVVAWVKSYCWHNNSCHRDIWNRLYTLFERTTGERLPEKDRLDWLEDNDLLGKLYQVTCLVR